MSKQFIEEYLNIAPTHNDSACRALRHYETKSNERDIKMFEQIKDRNGNVFNGKRLNSPSLPPFSMYEVSINFGTTVEEMKKHWKCIK
jgi:hypothetical protein